MKKIIPAMLILPLSLILFACGKDKFETKPRIEVKSYSSQQISQHGTLTIKLNYFDKEGDLGKGPFWAARYRLNAQPLGTSDADRADTLNYALPEFPPRDNGEISLQLDYDTFLKESFTQNDTIFFRIAVSDKAGNKSDTINTEPIVILLP